MTRLLVVTPMLNELSNLRELAEQVSQSTFKPATWVLVDDGSTDGTLELATQLSHELPYVRVVRHLNTGGLIGGSAFRAWTSGVDSVDLSSYDLIMKLDADVDLPPLYLESVAAVLAADHTVGVAGGVLRRESGREQNLHVPGPVKMYSVAGYQALATVPRAVGFDVVDEIALSLKGYSTHVIRDLRFGVRRPIGASQGLVHGRRRNGQVCRWVGYFPPYFLLHAARYVARRPVGVGTAAMVWGYLRAPASPYSPEIRAAHSRLQRDKLAELTTSPIRWLRETYRA